MTESVAANEAASRLQGANIAAAIFSAIRSGSADTVTRRDLEYSLETSGILHNDPRVAETMATLRDCTDLEPIDLDRFRKVLHPSNATLIHRALKGELAIRDFERFRNKFAALFEMVRDLRDGEVASYIPELARVDPERYALGVCTIDGQRFSFGDDAESYCVQSTCKPINYAIALEQLGVAAVHSHVGREPSGQSFNEITLNKKRLPHNPMINAGAIMTASMIKASYSQADRFAHVMRVWRELAGNERAGFDNTIYLSEKETADRNFALAYFMRENNAFPPGTDISTTLDLYFQCCSITVTAKQMAVVAATFANGGVCPLTDRRIFSSDTIKNCLSLMYSCGMYDFSGEYAFTVGLPAKSGVSGSLMIVVPGVCGIALWSPRLDPLGNSVRGVEFSKRLVKTFPFHTYSSMVDGSDMTDLGGSYASHALDDSFHLCAAGSRGDVGELRHLIAAGVDVNRADYDGRSALHLSASEGHQEVVEFLLNQGARPNPVDRWGNTPVDDARRSNHSAIAELLELAAAGDLAGQSPADSPDTKKTDHIGKRPLIDKQLPKIKRAGSANTG